jgi:hypothetical protein
MRYTFAQVSFSFYAEGKHEEIKQQLEDALIKACKQLKTIEGVSITFTQFKTEREEF